MRSISRFCNTCQLDKCLEDFYRDKTKKDGRHSQCKTCASSRGQERYQSNEAIRIRAKKRARAWDLANPERRLANHRRWDATNAEREKQRKHTLGQTQEYKEKDHLKYLKNAEQIKERTRLAQWKKKNPDKARTASRRLEAKRRARKLGLPDAWTKRDEIFLMTYWDGCCAVCGAQSGLWHVIALDHWVPLSAEECPGTVAGNMLPLCHAKKGAPQGMFGCNQSKRNTMPGGWLIKKMGEKKGRKKLRQIEQFLDEAKQYGTMELAAS